MFPYRVLAAVVQTPRGRTPDEIYAQALTDPATIFVVVLMLLSVVLVAWFGGRSGKGGKQA